jgi:hypothetical protein
LTDKNIYSFPGSPREIVQGGTILLWGTWDRLRLLSKLRVCCPKPLLQIKFEIPMFIIFEHYFTNQNHGRKLDRVGVSEEKK